MKNFNSNPIKHEHWDPSKGDFINDRIVQDDKLFEKRQQKKKKNVLFLVLTHILFLFNLIVVLIAHLSNTFIL